MPAALHLIAFVPGSDNLVLRDTAAGWLLPFSSIQPGERPCDVASRLARAVGLKGSVLHEAPLDIPGTHESVRYCSFALSSDQSCSSEWRLGDAGTLTDTNALSANQAAAVRICLQRESRPSAPFDSTRGTNGAKTWACQQLGVRKDDVVVTHLRTNRFDLVLQLRFAERSVFLKAGPYRVPDEARLTTTLAALAPGAFSETLAVSIRSQRWLSSAVEGEPLSCRLGDRSAIVRAVRTLAAAQRLSSTAGEPRAVLARRSVCPRSLSRVAANLIRGVGALGMADERRLAMAISGVERACNQLAAADLPDAWLHADCYAGNIMIGDRQEAFIDTEYSFWGPSVLPLWRLYSDAVHTRDTSDLLDLMVDAYTREWPSEVRGRMLDAMSCLPVVGQIFYLMMLEERARRRLTEIGRSYSRDIVLRRLQFGVDELITYACEDRCGSREACHSHA